MKVQIEIPSKALAFAQATALLTAKDESEEQAITALVEQCKDETITADPKFFGEDHDKIAFTLALAVIMQKVARKK